MKGHINVYRRTIAWGLGTVISLAGVIKLLLFSSGFLDVMFYASLLLSGLILIIVSEVVFELRKTQLEIDRDETIKHTLPSLVLAICPQCKSRISSKSKYCPECGTDLVTTV